jgi:hypothetical protein
LFYRALDAPTQFVDVGGGMRAWRFSANPNLNAGALPATSGLRADVSTCRISEA